MVYQVADFKLVFLPIQSPLQFLTNSANATMDQRWGFLVPWCEALNRRFDFNGTEYEDTDRDAQTRRLQ